MQVDVCVATFRRPELLRKLIVALSKQRVDGDVNLRVIVIDNDPNKSAEVLVREIMKDLSFELIYEHEPVRGISHARNRALDLVNAQYVAFIDDDEFPVPNWIDNLISAQRLYDADVVFGPVIGMIPEDAPNWARRHPSFVHKRLATGTQLKTGATSNALIKREALGFPMERFNVNYALTGGSDTELFFRIYRKGKLLIWCDEAPVFENIPRERLSTEWVYLRAYRSGQCFARVFCSDLKGISRLIYMGRKIIQLFAATSAAVVVAPFSEVYLVRFSTYAKRSLGVLSVMLGSTQYVEEYAQPSYRSGAALDDDSAA